MVTSSLAFLLHAWDPGRPGMHNFMTYDRRWVDLPHTATMSAGRPGPWARWRRHIPRPEARAACGC